MQSTQCPDERELRAFSLGNLPGGSFEQIAAHVAMCGRCEAALQALDSQADDLVTHLRGLPGAEANGEESVPEELVAAARSAFGQQGSESSEIVIDPGRKIAGKLAEGPFRLGKFELLEELGDGSFGYVFRARDTELDRTVAIKIQRSGSLGGREDTDRFLREARSTAQLKHPGIVALHDIGQTEDGVCYLVTEYLEGETLESEMTDGRFEFDHAAQLVATLADALQYAHEHGVIHRDVKPSNIMLDATGRPHIMDFGLAKREMGDSTMTHQGQIMGTPAYMSPEQARGESHDVDARSDIYSLGVILYELLTGERPFHGNRRMLILQVLEDEPRPPRRLNEKVPRDLETICLKAMAKPPGRRYATAGELADDLRRFLDGQPILARPVGYAERFGRWCRRYPLAVSLFVAVTMGSVAGLFYLSSLSEHFVQQTALDGARDQAKMLDEIWRFYSDLIGGMQDYFKKIKKKVPVRVKADYSIEHGELPIPARFAIEMGREISEASDMEVRLFSRYPWPDRKEKKDGGPLDQFEREALDRLETKDRNGQYKYQEYADFVEEDGRRWLLYARPRLMEKSCLDCHNDKKSKSPKTDWKVGDVVGVQKIKRPLDQDITAVRDGLRGAFWLMITSAAVLLAVCVVITRGVRRGS